MGLDNVEFAENASKRFAISRGARVDEDVAERLSASFGFCIGSDFSSSLAPRSVSSTAPTTPSDLLSATNTSSNRGIESILSKGGDGL